MPPPPAPLPKDLHLGWQDCPCIDGSTTAQPLVSLIISRMLGLGARWNTRKTRDFRNADNAYERILLPIFGQSPNIMTGEDYSGYSGLRLGVTLSGTHEAYRNLATGMSDFILVARPPSVGELELVKEKGTEFDVRPIGYDAFVFLLNVKNPLSSLTVQQVQDIYQGRVLNWKEVGGDDVKISAYQREINSGSQETMETLVMKDLIMAPPGESMVGYGMGGPYIKLRQSPDGIAYTFYYYHTMQSCEPMVLKLVPVKTGTTPDAKWEYRGESVPEPLETKIIAVNGIMPSPETITNHTSRFATEVYVVVCTDLPTNSPAVRLRDWLLTPEGQALVKESGYVPLGK